MLALPCICIHVCAYIWSSCFYHLRLIHRVHCHCVVNEYLHVMCVFFNQKDIWQPILCCCVIIKKNYRILITIRLRQILTREFCCYGYFFKFKFHKSDFTHTSKHEITCPHQLETKAMRMGALCCALQSLVGDLNLLKEVSIFFQISNLHSYNIQLH